MATKTTKKSDDTLRMVQEILTSDSKDLRSMLYKDIIRNALKCKRGELDILDLKIINRAVAEFQHAACVFKPYRDLRKVSIFGSARITRRNPYYQLAANFGRLLVEKGFMVITGAASGIMRAGIEGAGPENSFGVNILLPSEKGAAGLFREDPKLLRFKYFFTRKVFFVMEADAIALFPGGFGTHDEGFEVLTLLQTGKAPPMPVVLMELPGERYWETWDKFIKQQLLARRFIAPEDRSFYRIIHSPEQAAEWIKSYYSTYHSARQVGDRLVIRLEKALTDGHLLKLNGAFADIVKYGEIVKTSVITEEKDEPALISKPRIAFAYNRRSAGRLNQMILMINELGRAN